MRANLRERSASQVDMRRSEVPADAAGLIRAARQVAPKIEGARAEIERERQIPRGLVDAMGAAGLFALWVPKAFDGPELNLVDFIRVIEELASADGSAAWCTTVAACYSRIAGYLQPEIARRIFGGGRTVVAGTINPTGKAFAVDGGYRVTGRWAYGTGILHSTWTLGNCIVHDRDGPRRGSSGAPEIRLLIFPTSAVEVIDTWDVSGLRGTGSHDYRVADLFVRDDHSIACFDATPLQPGTLYAVPMITVLSVAIAAVPLGIARGAIDAAIELAMIKTPYASSLLLRDKPTFQAALGRAETLLGSARSYLLATVNDLWEEVSSGAAASMRRRSLVRLACTQAAQSAAQAVDLMYNAGGSTSLYESGRLERCFRDVHACTQHIATSTDSYELGGRVLLGLDPGRPQF
jgi:indole-3-acetate monooxygenase